MDNEAYHSDFSHISTTMLKLWLKSRVEYYRTFITGDMTPRKASKVMQLGTIGHAIAAEGKKLHNLAVVYPDDCLNKAGGLIPAKAAAFRAECEGMVCLKRDEYDDIRCAVDVIFGDANLRKLIELATYKEKPFFTKLEGLPVKCKPDLVCELDDSVSIFDLKFSSEIDPRSFKRSSRSFGYAWQDAHYSAILRELTGKPVSFKFICIETKYPFRIQPYWFEVSQRENVAGIHRQHLRDLAECYRTNTWVDDWKPEVELSPWEFNDTEEVEVAYDFDADNAVDLDI